MTGVVFQVYSLKTNITQFSPSEIQERDAKSNPTLGNNKLNTRQLKIVKESSQVCLIVQKFDF